VPGPMSGTQTEILTQSGLAESKCEAGALMSFDSAKWLGFIPMSISNRLTADLCSPSSKVIIRLNSLIQHSVITQGDISSSSGEILVIR
jgi:hypothetical protein